MFKALNLLRQIRKPLQTSIRYYPYPKSFYDDLKIQPQPNCNRLCNGLTVVSQERAGLDHICLGLFFAAGSRYESRFNNGITHFFEHIAFKGTMKRNAKAIQCIMSKTGARFKCFTQRELVVYYVECLSEDICLIVNLLAECIFCNRLDNDEINRQKSIVYQEMMVKEEDYTEVLFDYLHTAAFMNTSLSQSVLGRSSNLANFCDKTIHRHINTVFAPTNTVLCAVGGVCHNQLVDLANHYLMKLEPVHCAAQQYRFTAGDVRFRNDDEPLAYTAIGFEAPGLCDHRSYIMDVCTMLIGGWDRSQPGGLPHANQLARASSIGNVAHAYRSFYFKYTDTGLWGITFLSDGENNEYMLYNIQNEIKRMCLIITQNEVARAKHEVKTRLLMKNESVTGCCLHLGKMTLFNRGRAPLYQELHEIEQVTADSIKQLCQHLLYDKCFASAAVGAIEAVPTPSRMHVGRYSLLY